MNVSLCLCGLTKTISYIITSFDIVAWPTPCETATCLMIFKNRRGFTSLLLSQLK